MTLKPLTKLQRIGVLFLAFAWGLSACGSPVNVQSSAGVSAQPPVELHIGYQRGGNWTLLKAQGTLEKKFGNKVNISWTLFPAGPQLLEAMNAGSIDVGATGETPPIFAQAAGTPLLYIAAQSGSGAGSAIIVPKESPLKSVTDLKGKKVVFQKASASHLLLVRALEKFGLTYNDVQPVFLAPAEARAAFQGGSVDAWVIWNPFLEGAKQELGARELIDGVDVAATKGYILAWQPYVENHADILLDVIKELQAANQWIPRHQDEYARLLAKETGVAAEVWKGSLTTEIPDIVFIDSETIAYQQKVANTFSNLGLIPQQLDIQSVAWIPNQAKTK